MVQNFLIDEAGLKNLPVDQSPSGQIGVEFRTYEGLGHYIGDDEWEDVAEWLRKVIPAL